MAMCGPFLADGPAICIRDASFAWSFTAQPVLRNVDLVVPRGHLVAVLGAVGSGKSALATALLGELVRLEGHVATRVS